MKVAVLTIGDELCIGQIVNTNAAWIAAACTHEGWRVVAHVVVGDSLEHIIEEARRLLSIADVLLMSGGLGPTHDDRTKEALVCMLDDTLATHQATLQHLQEMFRRLGRELTQRNAAQALLPSTCEALRNDNGTAPGMWFTLKAKTRHNPAERDKVIVAMPGVPQEMKHLMENHVIPRLRRLYPEDVVVRTRTLLTTGIAESNLADLIGDVAVVVEGQELAFLPSASGVKLRITVTAPQAEVDALLERIESRVRARAGRFIYGTESDAYHAIVGRMLSERSITVAVAESCTGGLLGATLTAASGASAYFLGGVLCYSNDMKVRLVGVRPETLRLYGAVSEETARELASGVRERCQATIGIGITGIAGPEGGTPEKPVGTVWIGIADTHTIEAQRYNFLGDRASIRERSVSVALQLLFKKALIYDTVLPTSMPRA
ncbi:MAG: competence/damage-inducible protein A [Bacteroidota bacterium]|nr:competence/damage-inducible protein A [Candidatus Kapabacteria bacterium]MDW8219435.1 competence/damage-inducible protein A [Bacteroidota bacterium]